MATAAYLLHSRAFQESSAIVDYFTEQQGIVSVVARGFKRRRSRWHGAVQPFLQVAIDWIGKTELKTLTQVETSGYQPTLTGEKIRLGLYLNELMIRLLHRGDPYPILFGHYHETLSSIALSCEPVDWEVHLRHFEVALLRELGYGLDCQCEPDLLYRYEPDNGIVEVSDPKRCQAVSGASLIALQQGKLETPQQRLEAKQFMRQVLSHYLGEKPLESRKLFTPMKRD